MIVDDEPPAVDELNFILSEIPGIGVIGSVHSAANAIKAIRATQPDLVFLDIKMPGRDGFDVVQACASLQKTPFFVFATAYDEHAVKAFEASAIDYILKPFQADRVKSSVERVKKLMLTQREGALCGKLEKLVEHIHMLANPIIKVSVEHKGRILLLNPDRIVYCKAEKKEILVCTDAQCYTLHGTVSLDALEQKLETHGFFRSHRGYLVNLACIKEVAPWFNGKYILTTTDQASTEVPVSRRRVKPLKTQLGL